jgi:hypothetical protein
LQHDSLGNFQALTFPRLDPLPVIVLSFSARETDGVAHLIRSEYPSIENLDSGPARRQLTKSNN